MSDRTYKGAFVVAVVICLALAGGLGYVLLRRNIRPKAEEFSPIVAKGPEATTSPSSKSHPESASDTNDASDSGSSPPPLTPVQLSPQRLQAVGVKFAEVEYKQVRDDLRATGNVDVNEQQVAYVQTRFPGWLQKVYADATYQYVRKGQPLFTIYSPDLVSTEQEYLLAKENQQTLAGEQSGAAGQESTWLMQAATERLRQFGIPPREIEQLERSGKVQREITFDSPVSGYITERNALPNQYVQPETKLYTIADLSTVWVYAQVFQTDIGRLKPGDMGTVTVDAYSGREFRGRVDQILPQVDPTTRTVRVRLVFSNPAMLLKPGMFVNVQLEVPMGRQLVIPASGVLQSGTRQIAFVDHGQGYLEPREIELGPRTDDEFVVRKGLRAGERIVASANFLVDSEAQLQAALGSFAPPPPGASRTGDANAPATQASIDFSTDPSPPHKGRNAVRVKLTSADGKPISGAQVTVTFLMPAMPAMGMAAMRTPINLSDKGNGLYEGSGDLQSGGTWQVTILAQQNGQTIATKQLNVSAAGGM
jgi:RND family efflux transporter MFP subunit